jgi:hypothetical protein
VQNQSDLKEEERRRQEEEKERRTEVVSATSTSLVDLLRLLPFPLLDTDGGARPAFSLLFAMIACSLSSSADEADVLLVMIGVLSSVSVRSSSSSSASSTLSSATSFTPRRLSPLLQIPTPLPALNPCDEPAEACPSTPLCNRSSGLCIS